MPPWSPSVEDDLVLIREALFFDRRSHFPLRVQGGDVVMIDPMSERILPAGRIDRADDTNLAGSMRGFRGMMSFLQFPVDRFWGKADSQWETVRLKDRKNGFPFDQFL